MVPRDLKPANLFAARGADGRVRVKVLDFGVSKVAAQIRQMALTSTGTALGTPYYMAPEQLKSAKGVDARADIWSLGVALYELLTGTLPFDGKSFGMLFMQIVSEDPQPIHVRKPEIPVGLSEIVQTCMKKEREQRYADLAALVQELAKFASPSGQAQAQRITQGRGVAQPARDSNPMPAMKLKGTMLMANAPSALQAVRDAQAAVQAARQSSPDLTGTSPMPQVSPLSNVPNPPTGPSAQSASNIPVAARASVPNPPPMQDSGRWSTPQAQAPMPPSRVTPPAHVMKPEAAARKHPPMALVVGFIVACALMLAAGVFFFVRARGH
jgi:serine/threonine-protein kinase